MPKERDELSKGVVIGTALPFLFHISDYELMIELMMICRVNTQYI